MKEHGGAADETHVSLKNKLRDSKLENADLKDPLKAARTIEFEPHCLNMSASLNDKLKEVNTENVDLNDQPATTVRTTAETHK